MQNDRENGSSNEFISSPPVSSGRFFSRENTAQIGRFNIPFPFSAILGLLMIPVLFIAAGVSIPVSLVSRYVTRRREARFATEMKAAGRWISWGEASSQVTDRGTFIGEYLSFKGPYRLWWTSEDISQISPHPCCFEDIPWGFEDGGFFGWCGCRLTDPVSGTAAIVDFNDNDRKEVIRLLAELEAALFPLGRAGSKNNQTYVRHKTERSFSDRS